MIRSPAAVISTTVPSASTRPNRCGSTEGGTATAGAAAAAGRGWGAGRGPGRGAGLGVGLGVAGACCADAPVVSPDPGSLLVIFVPHPSARADPRTCRATRRPIASVAIQAGRLAPCAQLRDAWCAAVAIGAHLPAPSGPGPVAWPSRENGLDKADIAALLALGAALFVAMGDVIHQRSAHEVTDQPVGHLQLFAQLLRDRMWWLGSLVSAVGFGLQAAALGLGSVLLVQALLVTSLLFALPLNARANHHRVSRFEWTWAVLL